MYNFYSSYWIYVLPGLLLGMYAQAKIRAAYGTYSKIANRRGITGAQLALDMLHRGGIYDVQIERIQGTLTDHYDPRSHTLRLSNGVHDADSIAALGIAAHEVGHAMQHAQAYAPLRIRNAIVPMANIGSRFAFMLVFIGMFFRSSLIDLGILLFAFTFLFQLITLPVELNATRRAKSVLSRDYLTDSEMEGVHKVLGAAALTYVAALVSSLGTLLHLLNLSGRRRN
ncbi:MAG: zinc metallopeptidase [Tissierellia bacterium]|nr:zinc metallopeptidase [Tissierellia bacterium]